MRKYLFLLLPLLLCSCVTVIDSAGQKHLRSALQVTYAHVPGWDYCAGKWRHVTPDGQSQCDCFGEEGEVLPACRSCYDEDKNLKPDCVAGFYEPLTKAQYCAQYPETEWCRENTIADAVAARKRHCAEDPFDCELHVTGYWIKRGGKLMPPQPECHP